jgi:ferritin
MLSPKMQDAFNKQMNAEMYSSYLYLAMAAWFENAYLPGFAQWMHAQAKEEWAHAMKFYGHINDRGGRMLLTPIAGPPTDWATTLAVFEDVAKHEAKVTGLIHDLAALAAAEKDPAAAVFLQWFVSEQVEEEASVDAVLAQLKMIGESKSSLLMIDHHMGKRGKE